MRGFRTFAATAFPEGDAVYAMRGPLIRLDHHEPDGNGRTELRRVLWLKPDEAVALGAQLRFALAQLGGGKARARRRGGVHVIARILVFAGGLTAALLFADRIVAGFVQCASAGSCPW